MLGYMQHKQCGSVQVSPAHWRLLMAGATSTLTAGAAVLPPRSQGPEQTPLLRDTRRSRAASP